MRHFLLLVFTVLQPIACEFRKKICFFLSLCEAFRRLLRGKYCQQTNKNYTKPLFNSTSESDVWKIVTRFLVVTLLCRGANRQKVHLSLLSWGDTWEAISSCQGLSARIFPADLQSCQQGRKKKGENVKKNVIWLLSEFWGWND